MLRAARPDAARYTENMPPSVRLIAIDIDGTLLPSSGTTISERNCQALRAAHAAGIHVVIATGRRHAYALPIVEQAGLPSDSIMLSSNGTVVRSFAGDLLDRTLLSTATARALCGVLRTYGETVVFTFDRDGEESLVVENLAAVHQQIARWVESNRTHIREITPLERAFDNGDQPIQGMMCGPIAVARAAETALLATPLGQAVAMHRTEYPDRDLGILDLLPPGCSKGVALDLLAQSYGLGAHEVMAIGDNFNDVEMLDYAGFPVLMGNSSPDMMAMAEARGWQIARTNDQDGVALVIEAALAASEPKVTPPSVTSETMEQEKTPVPAW